MVLDISTAKEILTHALNRLVEIEVNANSIDHHAREQAYRAIAGMYARCQRSPGDLQKAIMQTLKDLSLFEGEFTTAFEANPPLECGIFYEIKVTGPAL